MSTFSGSIPLRFTENPAGHVQFKDGTVHHIQFSTQKMAERIREYLNLCDASNVTLIERINYAMSGTYQRDHFEVTQIVTPVPAVPLNPQPERPWQKDGLAHDLEQMLSEIDRQIHMLKNRAEQAGFSVYTFQDRQGRFILPDLLIQKAQLSRELETILRENRRYQEALEAFENYKNSPVTYIQLTTPPKRRWFV